MTKDLQEIAITEITPSEEHTAELNVKLQLDIATFTNRAFLNKQERCDMQEYHNKPGRNKIIGLLNFDENGNYLPDLYKADKDVVKMLYPIGDIIDFESAGTLIIDREQLDPNLRNISYFIYMVDPELYEEYRINQNFLGESLPTYMFDRNKSNGIRVFKNYFDLVKHLRFNKLITYCMGPRSMFYLRYYLHEIHIHTTKNCWTYGASIKNSVAEQVLVSIKRHLAFNTSYSTTLDIKYTEDKHSEYRKLAAHFKMNLEDIIKQENTIMIQRFSKQTLHSKNICKIRSQQASKYEAIGIMPYHHILIHNDMAICFIWDSRSIELCIPASEIEQKHLTYNVIDSKNDLKLKGDAPQNVKDFIESCKYDLPVQFRFEETKETTEK